MRLAFLLLLCSCAPASTVNTTPPKAQPTSSPPSANLEPKRPAFEPEVRAILAQPPSCGPRLLALAQYDMDGLDLTNQVFPFVGKLRSRLLACQADPQWLAEDHRRLSAAKWARMWLAMWGDPADDAIVEQFLAERSDFAVREKGTEAETAQKAMAAWVDQHFAREGFPDPKTRTANSFHLVVPEEGGRALALFEVQYKHWGYAMQVVMVERDGRWQVRMSLHTATWHYDDEL